MVAMGMIFFLIYGIIYNLKGKLLIYPDRLVEIGVFKRREMELSEIKGYKEDRNYVYFLPKSKDRKSLKITRYMGNNNAFYSWLHKNFDRIDHIERVEDIASILKNDQYGANIEVRAQRLRVAKYIAGTLNAIGTILAILLFFYPKPYQLVTIIAIIFPVVVVICLHFFKGLITIDERAGKGNPTVAYALGFTSMTLALRGLLDYHILEYSHLWFSVLVIGLLFIIIIFSATTEFHIKSVKNIVPVLAIALVAFTYSYGVAINVNCLYDNSKPDIYYSEVSDMRITTGNITSYYIKLNPWGPVAEIDEVVISKSLYDQLVIGDSVNIYLKKGEINIPWFKVSNK